jgi:hypothetical protein
MSDLVGLTFLEFRGSSQPVSETSVPVRHVRWERAKPVAALRSLHAPLDAPTGHRHTIVQVILAGALEAPVTGLDGRPHVMGRPFREAELCWDHLDYIHVHRYHVRNESDVEFAGRRKNTGGQARDWEVVRIRDSRVIVRPDALVEVVGDALARLQAQRPEAA